MLRPGQFVPAGIDPDSEVGENYWEIFNKLVPSVTNFLIVVDKDGTPQTLLSGGRIQTKFLNIGSLNMSETRLWGGAELFTGKGLALVNDSGDRKFVVYENASNYVEMFQREDEWGLKGRYNGNDIFQLGSTNKIGPFTIEGSWLSGSNLSLSGSQLGFSYEGHQVYVGSHPDMSISGAAKLGWYKLSGSSYSVDSRLKASLITLAPLTINTYALYSRGYNYLDTMVCGVVEGNFVTASITPNFRYFLHHSTGNVSRAMSDSWGIDGQVLTIVNCDNDNYNLTLTNIWQFNKNGGVTSASIEMTDGGAEVTLIKYGGKWLFAGRAGNAKF